MNSKDIKQLYASAFPAIRTHVVKNSGNIEDAEDVFQDAMVVLHNRMKKGGFTLTSKPETFLFAIARNLWYKKLRKPQTTEVTSTLSEVLTDELPLDEMDLHRLRERLYRQKFNELSTDCQTVIQLFLSGTTMTEIATSMGYSSEGYAKKKKFTCKEKLYSLIASDPYYADLKS